MWGSGDVPRPRGRSGAAGSWGEDGPLRVRRGRSVQRPLQAPRLRAPGCPQSTPTKCLPPSISLRYCFTRSVLAAADRALLHAPPRPPAPLPDAIPVRPVSLLLSGSRAVVQQGPAGGAPLPLRPLGPVGAARVGDEWLLGRVQGPRWPFSSSSPHGTPSASQYPTPNPENVTGVPRTALGEIRSANGRRGSCTCGRCRDRIRRLGGADSRHGGRGLVFLGWGDSWWSLRMPQGLLTGSEVHPAQAKREKESQRWPRQCMLK